MRLETELEEIRDRFKKGELVGLSLPVVIKPKNSPNIDSEFSVYIKRPTALTKGFDLYVRGGLTLPSEAKFGEQMPTKVMPTKLVNRCNAALALPL